MEILQIPMVAQMDNYTHSLLVVVAILMVSIFIWKLPLLSFGGGYLLHLFIDVWTHRTDAIYLFWPLSDFKIMGPVSYWEKAYTSTLFNVVNVALLSMVFGYLAHKYHWLSKAYQYLKRRHKRI